MLFILSSSNNKHDQWVTSFNPCAKSSDYLVPAAVCQLFLNVHRQHLTAEGQALGLLDHLLVRRHCVVAHHDVTLRNTRRN